MTGARLKWSTNYAILEKKVLDFDKPVESLRGQRLSKMRSINPVYSRRAMRTDSSDGMAQESRPVSSPSLACSTTGRGATGASVDANR